uniref:Glucoamylase (Glucan 1,4-alpha-glucosidase)) n=1 Tax=Ganoderma boninense TaxID=34458 RepID=A0A5K1JY25_9APHY|nr:Glucoamylase (EC (1,4-alpha-D-glucan glucohydrolase) (Glucan 1,4-alpha-glucosidase) [Ganoderma boninense]
MALDVPDWLKDHPDLRARGIMLHQDQRLFYTPRPYRSPSPQYVIKVLDPATEECSINEHLQHTLPSPNHSLPCEIIPSDPRLLVMPFGVEHLHRLRIAHLDICFGNIASASPYQASTDARLVAGKVYLIDFGQSRQLALGPGHQPPIVLPASQQDKPLNVTMFDPYSFDVYCTGKVLQRILLYTALPEAEFPWIPMRLLLFGHDPGDNQSLFIKVLDPDTEEGAISECLQHHSASPNHGLPAEIIPSEPRLLVMPFAGPLDMLDYRNLPDSSILDIFHQIIKGVEYMHKLNIAHLDICLDNAVYAFPRQAATDPRLVANKVYFMDFHTSRQLALGPGRQPQILLPPSQVEKPEGVTSLDPYDVYSAGMLIRHILRVGSTYL